ncbi:MAG: alginate export family protein [Cellvibrionaceae bacterium]|nr:alginate export family protein [Cellvibrionaceae bacterium]
MQKIKNVKSKFLLSVLASVCSVNVIAEEIVKANIDMRMRYESVDQSNALQDADALTLRTRVSVSTKAVEGFSAHIDMEDSRSLFGVDDYNNTLGDNRQFSVIADPEATEVDQAFVQYKNKGFKAKIGRQVMTYDGHRFVGHVGFRQDRQTFDGLSLSYQANKDLSLNYAYIGKRNRIFSDEKDIDSKDHLINIAYQTPIGKLVAYSYMLELDQGNGATNDSYGFSFKGKQSFDDIKFLYDLEYAMQTQKAAGLDFDADYQKLELGVQASGLTAKLGYELLGSDGGQYGFSTPLATLHKFNGWTDQFLGTPKQGLEDVYVSLAGKVDSAKWMVVYHDFSADESSPGLNDLGSELGVQVVMPFAKKYSVGLKYATYEAGDVAAGKVDTDKLWLWLGAKF